MRTDCGRRAFLTKTLSDPPRAVTPTAVLQDVPIITVKHNAAGHNDRPGPAVSPAGLFAGQDPPRLATIPRASRAAPSLDSCPLQLCSSRVPPGHTRLGKP